MSRPALINLLCNSLAHRYLPVALAGVAVLTLIPCLWQGWIGDDLVHRAWLLQPSRLPPRLHEAGLIPPHSGRLSTALMYLHSSTGPHLDVEKLVDSGVVPWWTSHGISVSFWRPVAALTQWVDYRLWPDSAELMHAQNMLWFGLAVFVVTLLYRRMLKPAWIAGLAALLYMLDDSYFIIVSSISKRNVLISLIFGILALFAHDRWRQHNSRISAILSTLFFLLSLLSAEAGISTIAYLFAYALFLDREKWTQRALSLAPSLIVVIVWRLTYNFLGYGVYNNGLYVDPIREPLRFVFAMLELGPILLLGQWGLPPADVYSFISEPLQKLIWFSALVFLVLVLIMLLPLLRKDRVAGFWGIGMLLSVVPACAMSLPSGRLLLFVGLGAMGLMAAFTGGLLSKEDWVPNSNTWRFLARGLCMILIVVHVAVAGLGRLVAPKAASLANDIRESMLQVGSEPELEGQDLIIVNSPSPFFFLYFPFLRAEQVAPLPRLTRILAPAFTTLKVTRTGENTLVIRARSDNLLSLEPPPQEVLGHPVYTLWRVNNILRAERFSRPGTEQIHLTGIVIEVTSVGEEGLPKETSFRFVSPLEDPSRKWLTWDWQTWSYVPFRVPAVGEWVQIAGPF